MKKRIVALMLLPAAALIANPDLSILHVDSYKLDVASSKVEWFAEKVTGKHHGIIKLKSGEVSNNHGAYTGRFVMDMTTLENSDLEGGSKTKLETHLKSADFFDVQKHPEAVYEITSMTPITPAPASGNNFNIKGNMTIKGITNEVSFPATVKFEGNKITAQAEIKIDRSKFDVRYGSKSFFPDIGDKAIMDEFVLKTDVTLNKQ